MADEAGRFFLFGGDLVRQDCDDAAFLVEANG
jgi:hypothetical protein